MSASGAVLHLGRQLDDQRAAAVLAPGLAAERARLHLVVVHGPLEQLALVRNVVVRRALLLPEVGAVRARLTRKKKQAKLDQRQSPRKDNFVITNSVFSLLVCGQRDNIIASLDLK